MQHLSSFSSRLKSLHHVGRKMSSRASWVAGCQLTSGSDVEANLGQAAGLVRQAAERGAEMVFLPEAFDFVGESRQQTLELAQTTTGGTVTAFQKLAAEHGVYLSLGGFHNRKTNPNSSYRVS